MRTLVPFPACQELKQRYLRPTAVVGKRSVFGMGFASHCETYSDFNKEAVSIILAQRAAQCS